MVENLIEKALEKLEQEIELARRIVERRNELYEKFSRKYGVSVTAATMEDYYRFLDDPLSQATRRAIERYARSLSTGIGSSYELERRIYMSIKRALINHMHISSLAIISYGTLLRLPAEEFYNYVDGELARDSLLRIRFWLKKPRTSVMVKISGKELFLSFARFPPILTIGTRPIEEEAAELCIMVTLSDLSRRDNLLDLSQRLNAARRFACIDCSVIATPQDVDEKRRSQIMSMCPRVIFAERFTEEEGLDRLTGILRDVFSL